MDRTEELREKIAELIFSDNNRVTGWENIDLHSKYEYLTMANQILQAFKECRRGAIGEGITAT